MAVNTIWFLSRISFVAASTFSSASRARARQLAALDAADAVEHADLGHSDYLLRLDDDQLTELVARLTGIVHEYLDHRGDRLVALHLLALPDGP